MFVTMTAVALRLPGCRGPRMVGRFPMGAWSMVSMSCVLMAMMIHSIGAVALSGGA